LSEVGRLEVLARVGWLRLMFGAEVAAVIEVAEGFAARAGLL
jgi:hypothetical protein